VARSTQGGAAVSLETLVRNLDRSRFSPMVLFHRARNPEVVAAIEAAGIPVFTLFDSSDSPPPTHDEERTRDTRGWFSRGGLRGRLLPLFDLVRALRDFIRRDVRLVRPLERFFREHRADLIHLNNGLRSHRAELIVSRRLSIPCVCHVRHFQIITAMERFLGARVSRFLYISRAIEAHYSQQKIRPARGQVIHNVTPIPPRLTEVERRKVRAEFGCGDDHVLAVNVGRIVPWKGQDVFLRALHRVASDVPGMRALVVGEADDTPRARAFEAGLRQMAVEHGIATRVIFTGLRSDVPALMAAADMVVHSAVKPEPFGRVIIEAMATGTPVIAADAGGVADIITSGENGLVTTPGDAEALAGAIRRLASSPELRRTLGAAGLQDAREHFSVERQVERIQRVYVECLGSGTACGMDKESTA
jgi:glycosyltransferase involved in cell wall biosynthesis